MANPDGREESDKLTFPNSRMVDEEERSGTKRKWESMEGMLNWLNETAKDPGYPMIGSLPERSKWKAYADEHWKQVLLARKALLLKTEDDLNTKQLTLQKGKKMHPSMYDDNLGPGYNLRERSKGRWKLPSEGQACPSPSDLDNPSITGISHIDNIADSLGRKRIGVGPRFQAEIPEWTDAAYESDSKRLGFKVWPLENTEQRQLPNERDPIGKGRQDSCGCQAPGSAECVRFHTTERSCKLKPELGSAFNHWKFSEMGEGAALSWKTYEEKKFESIAKSRAKHYWNQLRKAFPTKSRENLVSYYFNVFLLRREGCQNKSAADANSNGNDDDDNGSGSNGSEHEALKRPGSIFHSPNKPRSNTR